MREETEEGFMMVYGWFKIDEKKLLRFRRIFFICMMIFYIVGFMWYILTIVFMMLYGVNTFNLVYHMFGYIFMILVFLISSEVNSIDLVLYLRKGREV